MCGRYIQDLLKTGGLSTKIVMKMLSSSLAILVSMSFLTGIVPAHANSGGEQGQVRKERRAGNVLSLRDIEREVLPRMAGMQYLGPEYDSVAMAYRMKFIQNGKVQYVDVDARTGRIIGQSR